MNYGIRSLPFVEQNVQNITQKISGEFKLLLITLYNTWKIDLIDRLLAIARHDSIEFESCSRQLKFPNVWIQLLLVFVPDNTIPAVALSPGKQQF